MDNANLIGWKIESGDFCRGFHLSYDAVRGNALADHVVGEFGNCASDLDFRCADGEFG